MSTEKPARRTDPARRRAAAAACPNESPTGDREITLHGMHFHALIGVLDHERTIAQPIEVDLTVRVASDAGIVDYRRLYEIVERVLAHGPIDYLETLADRITRDTFEDARIRETRVAVRKPHVALPGPLAYTEVVVRRDRRAE